VERGHRRRQPGHEAAAPDSESSPARRAPNLSTLERFLPGCWSLFLSQRHIQRAAVIIRPSTPLKFKRLIKQRNYRLLYSACRTSKPGPKGPSAESILLQSHWVLVIMDQFTHRIVGVGVHAGDVDGVALCCMFNTATSSSGVPKYLSSDNDPLFLYHQWQANLRILGVDEVKTVPYTPQSHPFVERLIGTIRREYIDQQLFWNTIDLAQKLEGFRQYYNTHRVHTALDGATPSESSGETNIQCAASSKIH
jgi:hypothetical protein